MATLKKPVKFAHVVYRTRQFEPMIKWYQAVFGARIQHRDPVLAFLTYDDEHHRVALINMSIIQEKGPDRVPTGNVGVDHVAYGFSSLTVLLENYELLKAQGITPYWRIHHGVTISLYYADPDGNQMEFQVDCFDTSDGANGFMAGPHYDANSIGVEFDPEQMLARLRAGEPEHAMFVRPSDFPVSPVRGTALPA